MWSAAVGRAQVKQIINRALEMISIDSQYNSCGIGQLRMRIIINQEYLSILLYYLTTMSSVCVPSRFGQFL